MKRKEIQGLIATHLRKWWKRGYLEGTQSKPVPLRCMVCGESSKLGFSIHHIDPNIKKGDERYNAPENLAPPCGTCHNILTSKKAENPEEIINEIKFRHSKALGNRKL